MSEHITQTFKQKKIIEVHCQPNGHCHVQESDTVILSMERNPSSAKNQTQ